MLAKQLEKQGKISSKSAKTCASADNLQRSVALSKHGWKATVAVETENVSTRRADEPLSADSSLKVFLKRRSGRNASNSNKETRRSVLIADNERAACPKKRLTDIIGREPRIHF